MKKGESRLKYALPRAENLLYIVMTNVHENFRNGNDAKVDMVPLVQRAYTIVNETGVIPYKGFDADEVILERQ